MCVCPIEWEGIEPFACAGLLTTKAFLHRAAQSCNMSTPFVGADAMATTMDMGALRHAKTIARACYTSLLTMSV